MNHLYYGDNLAVLRDSIGSDSVDLIYLDPPFNSNASTNVLFRGPTGTDSAAQIEAFDDTWHWNDSTEEAFKEVMRGGNEGSRAMSKKPDKLVKSCWLKLHRMRSSVFLAGIAVCLALTSGQSVASTKELERAMHQVIPYDGGPYISLDTRKAYVHALLNYWSDFDSRVPRLSPFENDWLKKEIDTQGDRQSRAFNSREFALFSLSRDVGNCVSSLENLNAMFADQAKAKTEMFLWLGMVKCYSNMQAIMLDLQRAELSDGRFDGAFYTAGSSLIMDALLDEVIPSAMADTMGWTIRAN